MKQYLYKSIGLHLAVFIVMAFDLPFFARKPVEMGAAPMIVDLKDVQLAEMTNLPPKAVFGEEDKKATVPEKKEQKWSREETPAPEVKKEEPEIKEPESKKDFVETEQEKVPEIKPKEEKKEEKKPEPKPVPVPEKKPAPKPTPKPKPKPAPKPKPTPKKAEPAKTEPKAMANPLKSLMDSVSALEKEVGQEASPAVIKEGTQVSNMGVEGGTGGSYFSELSITETDAIASLLRECWNLDPGARGIENMIIQIRVYLNKDGTVRDAKILDTARYNSDPHFRAIAESARRAVYSAQNHNNVNVYKIFVDKYGDKYSMWNTIILNFNPMDASIK